MTMILNAPTDLIGARANSAAQRTRTAPLRIFSAIGMLFEAVQDGKSALRKYDESKAMSFENDAALRRAFDLPLSK